MNTTDIDVRVGTVAQLFSGDYRFHLPWFQRAYAWREEHAGRLLVDVKTAIEADRPRYFLGHLMLAKRRDRSEAALIDGQQRAITLTIMAALLRDMRPGTPEAQRLDALIRQTDLAGPEPAYRLTPQPLLAPFFAKFVQADGATKLEPDGDIMSLAESERTILANRNHIRALLTDLVPEDADRLRLISFLLDGCFLIIESVEDEEEAWSMLATEEETGLLFHSSERAKLSLISMMPRHEQEAAGHIWENCQGLVGSDGLSRLLCHVRALKLRKRSTKPVEKDLAQCFALNRTGIPFMANELHHRAELMHKLQNGRVGEQDLRSVLAPLLESLWWMEQQLWMPPALHWLGTRGESHVETPRFFYELDRLSWLLHIAGVDPIDKERQFLRIVGDIDDAPSVARMSHLAPEPRLVAAALGNLRAHTFYAKHYSHLLLRKLSRMLGANPTALGTANTIEHVLPRKPPKGRGWWRDFGNAETIANYANRLGNLVLLSEADNQRAGTADFLAKRRVFAGSGQKLAEDLAARYEVWDRRSIDDRTERMIEALCEGWEIKP